MSKGTATTLGFVTVPYFGIVRLGGSSFLPDMLTIELVRKLTVIKLGIESALFEKLLVSAALDDVTVLHN